MEQTFKFDADKVLAFAESAILETAVLAKAKEAGWIKEMDEGDIRRRLGKRALKKLDEGTITLEQARDEVIHARCIELDKCRRDTLAEIRRGSEIGLPSDISVRVEWHKSRTWGFLPKANVYADGTLTTGKVTQGYGFDKESTATSIAFKENPVFAWIVAIAAYQDHLEGKPINTGHAYRLDLFGASFCSGSGYNTHDQTIVRAGYERHPEFHGKMDSGYNYTLAKK